MDDDRLRELEVTDRLGFPRQAAQRPRNAACEQPGERDREQQNDQRGERRVVDEPVARRPSVRLSGMAVTRYSGGTSSSSKGLTDARQRCPCDLDRQRPAGRPLHAAHRSSSGYQHRHAEFVESRQCRRFIVGGGREQHSRASS
jgi:hypothetical protein